jgi:hypothetical protein
MGVDPASGLDKRDRFPDLAVAGHPGVRRDGRENDRIDLDGLARPRTAPHRRVGPIEDVGERLVTRFPLLHVGGLKLEALPPRTRPSPSESRSRRP